jgi:hypothetical protein
VVIMAASCQFIVISILDQISVRQVIEFHERNPCPTFYQIRKNDLKQASSSECALFNSGRVNHDSNVSDLSGPHPGRQTSPMISTKPVSLNVSFSIRDSLDLDSNLTEERDPHSEKHSSLKMSPDERRMNSSKPISLNEESRAILCRRWD